MIEFAAIYKGKGMQPSEKLKTMLNQMVKTWAFYKQDDSYIQEGWYLNFSDDAERKESHYSSPYQIQHSDVWPGRGTGMDVDHSHILRIEEDLENLEFLQDWAMVFNSIQSRESREILIRKYFLKEKSSDTFQKMYPGQARTISFERKIWMAKQDAVEAFGFDQYDEDGNWRNSRQVKRIRNQLRKQFRIRSNS